MVVYFLKSSRESGEPLISPAPGFFLQLVLPESVEPVWCKLGVPDRVLDVLVSQVMLDRPGVVAVVGELETTGVAEHVGMHRKPKSRQLTGASDDLTHG